MERERPDKLAHHAEGSEGIHKTVIMLGKRRLGYAYASKENPKELRDRLDEICLRYNTWTQIWLALKAAERGDKHWHAEVKAAIRAAGQEI